MKTRLAAVALLCGAFASAAVAVGGDAKAELKKFAGTWAVESARDRGKDAPEDKIKNTTFTFSGNKITFRQGTKEESEGTFKIDPTKKPRHIDLTIEGKPVPGIYAFEGGKLKICVNQGAERPTEFSSPEGSKITLIVLKRAKK
jgi:uncharacterized protein (TIGR03067 family)